MPYAKRLHTPAVITYAFGELRCDFVTLNKRTVEDADPYKKALLPPPVQGEVASLLASPSLEGEVADECQTERVLFNSPICRRHTL